MIGRWELIIRQEVGLLRLLMTAVSVLLWTACGDSGSGGDGDSDTAVDSVSDTASDSSTSQIADSDSEDSETDTIDTVDTVDSDSDSQGTVVHTLADYRVCESDVDCPVGMGSCIKEVPLNRPDVDGNTRVVLSDVLDGVGVGEGLCSEDCTTNGFVCAGLLLRDNTGAAVSYTCQLIAVGVAPYPDVVDSDSTGDVFPFDDQIDFDEVLIGQSWSAICMPPFGLDDQWPAEFCNACTATDGCVSGVCYDVAGHQPAQGAGICLGSCTDNICPKGFTCENAGGVQVCVPSLGACGDCKDVDGDGHGVGRCSGGVDVIYDCDDYNKDAYYGVEDMMHPFPTFCGVQDYNCNGLSDAGEQVGTVAYGNSHCTACYDDCYAEVDNGVWECVTGLAAEDATCQLNCIDSALYRDCTEDSYADALLSDGCETERTTGSNVYYCDMDGDSYGDMRAPYFTCPGELIEDVACDGDWILTGGDCDETDAEVNPSFTDTEIDDIDRDCDGTYNCYEDYDNDEHGVTVEVEVASKCSLAGNGGALVADDCGDTDPLQWSGNLETCDHSDNDCDGKVDNVAVNTSDLDTDSDTALVVMYRDADQDGYEDESQAFWVCDPAVYNLNAETVGQDAVFRFLNAGTPTDCNDFDDSISPSAAELCNSINDDCAGSTPDGFGDVYGAADGFGDECLTAGGQLGEWVCANGLQKCSDLAMNHDPALHAYSFDPDGAKMMAVDNEDNDNDGVEDRDEVFLFLVPNETALGSSCGTGGNGTARCPYVWGVKGNSVYDDADYYRGIAADADKQLVFSEGKYLTKSRAYMQEVSFLGGWSYDSAGGAWQRTANYSTLHLEQFEDDYSPAVEVALITWGRGNGLLEGMEIIVTPNTDRRNSKNLVLGLWVRTANALTIRDCRIEVGDGSGHGDIPSAGSTTSDCPDGDGPLPKIRVNAAYPVVLLSDLIRIYSGDNGTDGFPGGKPGMRRLVLADGEPNGNFWYASSGAKGGDGQDGTPGAPGVPIEYCSNFIPYTNSCLAWETLGAAGGGKSGCHGSGGTGGNPGGSSIGLMVWESSGLNVENLKVKKGSGGDGQVGGGGGRGGSGAVASAAVPGGTGGNGTGGAGGGGGQGGHSICVAHDAATGNDVFADIICDEEGARAGIGGPGGEGGDAGNSNDEIGKGGDGADGPRGVSTDVLCMDCGMGLPSAYGGCPQDETGLMSTTYTDSYGDHDVNVYCENGWALVMKHRAGYNDYINKEYASMTTATQYLVNNCSGYSDTSNCSLMLPVGQWGYLGNRMMLATDSHESKQSFVINNESNYRIWMANRTIVDGSTDSGFFERANEFGPMFSAIDMDNDQISDRHCAGASEYPTPWWYGGNGVCWRGSFWGNGGNTDKPFSSAPHWASTSDEQLWANIWVKWE